MPAYDPVTPSNPNNSSHCQIGILTKVSATVFALENYYQMDNNMGGRVRNHSIELGTVNSIKSPIDLEFISSTITIKRLAGMSFNTDLGFGLTDGAVQDLTPFAELDPAILIHVDRLNGIALIGTDLDVDSYESAPGTITDKGANNASNYFILNFLSFLVVIYGQEITTGASAVQDALDNDEPEALPTLVAEGLRLKKIAVIHGATDGTDPAEALIKDLTRFNQAQIQ